MTGIDPDTLRAYRESEYCVATTPPLILRIGVANPALGALHAAVGARSSAFVSACNPLGILTPETENLAHQMRLQRDLERRGLAYLPGVGRHPYCRDWPPEASYLVFGLTLPDARALAGDYRQNALVWMGTAGVPQLILLR